VVLSSRRFSALEGGSFLAQCANHLLGHIKDVPGGEGRFYPRPCVSTTDRQRDIARAHVSVTVAVSTYASRALSVAVVYDLTASFPIAAYTVCRQMYALLLGQERMRQANNVQRNMRKRDTNEIKTKQSNTTCEVRVCVSEQTVSRVC